MDAKIAWFEIPVSDFERARQFYQAVLEVEIMVLDLGNIKMGLLPKGSGSLMLNPYYTPSESGVLIYLDANPSIDAVIDRIKAANGTIVQPKKLVSEDVGYMCLFLDSEGNRIALMAKS